VANNYHGQQPISDIAFRLFSDKASNLCSGIAPRRSGMPLKKAPCPVAIFPNKPADDEKSPMARVLRVRPSEES